jgi:hypothetical protein
MTGLANTLSSGDYRKINVYRNSIFEERIYLRVFRVFSVGYSGKIRVFLYGDLVNPWYQ